VTSDELMQPKAGKRVLVGKSKQIRLILLIASVVLFVKTAIDLLEAYSNIADNSGATFQVKNNLLLVGGVNFVGLIGEFWEKLESNITRAIYSIPNSQA
jgi:hypothetical protein